ncbi:MAG: TolC family protein [Bryobacter sp.]|nr:TolC family protein [Bryobacter sp.]
MRYLFVLLPALLCAETHKLTFDQALERARREAPEVLLARFDEVQAQQAIRIARDPFSPKVAVGSGLAYTNGFPLSIEGSAPSLFQAKISQSLFNRPQSYLVAKSRVDSQSVAQSVNERRDAALEKTAKLYLDANLAQRNLELLRQQIANLEAVSSTVDARVEEGRALAIESRRAAVNSRKAQQRLRLLNSELQQVQRTLAFVLGFPTEDLVEIEPLAALATALPSQEEEAIQAALANSRELKRLQLDMQAKDLEVRANRAAYLPQVDLVAQYGLFARFNNFDRFFNSFQRNNALVGLSFKFPVVPGVASSAQAASALNEINRLRLRLTNTRNRIALDTRKLLEDLRLQSENRDLAKLDLDVARDQVSLILVQMEEGKASRRQLEESRFLEAEKWIAYYEAQHAMDRAGVSLLAALGQLDQLAVR